MPNCCTRLSRRVLRHVAKVLTFATVSGTAETYGNSSGPSVAKVPGAAGKRGLLRLGQAHVLG
jgi:hypothetical protein